MILMLRNLVCFKQVLSKIDLMEFGHYALPSRHRPSARSVYQCRVSEPKKGLAVHVSLFCAVQRAAAEYMNAWCSRQARV